MADWRSIREFPLYSVNEYGYVRNEKRGSILNVRANQQGHLFLGLFHQKEQHMRAVAVLVAEAFLEKPPGFNREPHNVIFLNGDRTDCRAVNLAWRTRRFGYRYNEMFKTRPYNVGVEVPEIGRRFGLLRDFCTTYGLVEQATYYEMKHGEPCDIYGWRMNEIERLD